MPAARFDNTDGRLRGRKGTARRLRLWTVNPYCAMCGRLTTYPAGFELDHKIPLIKKGPDTDDNLQVLCNGPTGCHLKKTAEDFGQRLAVKIGLDGFPE